MRKTQADIDMKKRSSMSEERCKRLTIRHKKELNILNIKVDNRWSELCTQRRKELEILKKQYQNNKLYLSSKYSPKLNKIKTMPKSKRTQSIY